MIDVIGYLAGIGAAVMWMPQAYRSIRLRQSGESLAGISLTAYLIACAFNALLACYGLLNGAAPVIAAGSVNFVCTAVIVANVALATKRPRT